MTNIRELERKTIETSMTFVEQDKHASPMPQMHKNDEGVNLPETPTCVGAFPINISSNPTFPISTSTWDSTSPRIMSKKDVETTAATCRRLLREGVSKEAVQMRMHQDGVEKNWDVLQAVFSSDSVDKDFYTNRLDQDTPHHSPLTEVPRRCAQAQELIDEWKDEKDVLSKESVDLVDPKRAEEISLALRAFEDMTLDELAEAIDYLEPIQGNRIHILHTLLPTIDERSLVLAYCGDDLNLSPSSRWLRRIASVPEAGTKVKVVQAITGFKAKAEKLSEKFQLVERASNQVVDSTKLKQLLKLVLGIGVILKRMKHTRTISPKDETFEEINNQSIEQTENEQVKIIDLVVRCTIASGKPSLDLMGDLPDCEAASRIHISDLQQDLTDLCRTLHTTEDELKSMRRDIITTARWPEVEVTLHKGYRRLEHFVADATTRISRLELERDLALASCRRLSEFCGVQTGKSTTACLSIVTKFAMDLDRVAQDYCERRKAVEENNEDTLFATETPMIQTNMIDKRHLRHVQSLVEAYDDMVDDMMDDVDADPKAKEARQLTIVVITCGTPHEDSGIIDESCLRPVKSLVELYNDIIQECENATKDSVFHDGGEEMLQTLT